MSLNIGRSWSFIKYHDAVRSYRLMLEHRFTHMSDPFPRVLIEEGFVRILAVMARMTYGNTNMPKFCIQSLVRIVSNVDPMEAKAILSELLSYNVIELISICLRGGIDSLTIDGFEI